MSESKCKHGGHCGIGGYCDECPYHEDPSGSPVMIAVTETRIEAIIQSLGDGADYMRESLETHLASLGEATRKNKGTADIIRADIKAAKSNADALRKTL